MNVLTTSLDRQVLHRVSLSFKEHLCALSGIFRICLVLLGFFVLASYFSDFSDFHRTFRDSQSEKSAFSPLQITQWMNFEL